MKKRLKVFRYVCLILICVGVSIPVHAIEIKQDHSASIIRPYNFGFGSINDGDEGVSKLIEAGNFKHLTFTDSTGYSIKYWAHIPTDINGDYIKNLPLVMYMHGYSDGGNNNIAIRYHNGVVFKLIQQQDKPERQAIILVPQTPNAQNGPGESDYFKDQWVGIKGNDKWSQWNRQEWNMDEISRTKNLNAVVELVKATQNETQADLNRAYVTGISMGGYATWDLISRNDENLFAAAVPICSVGDPNKIENAKNIPIKLFHGSLDGTVNPNSSKRMYSSLRKYGNVSYVEYEKENHPSWNAAYSPVLDDNQNGKSNLDDLIDWMFNQSRNGTLDNKVDKGPLVSIIWDAKQEKEENYSFAKWEKLQNTIEQAESLINNDSNDSVVKELIKTLDAIITDENKDKADMSELLNKIEEGEKLKEEDYTISTWLEFQQALTKAKEIVQNPDTLQEDIDAMLLVLETAINNLVQINNGEINKTALQIAIKAAQNASLENVIPTVVKEFNEALANAITINDKANVNQEEVDKAFDRLAKAMHMLEFFKGDKKTLKTFIDQVSDLTESQYTEGTWKTFQDALDKANEVYKDVNAMQEKVDQTYTELVKAFVNLRYKPNKDLLKDLITKAEGLDAANYSVESFGKVSRALENARAVLDNLEATVVEVNNANDALTKALSGLVAKPVDPSISDTPVKPSSKVNGKESSVKTGDTMGFVGLLGLGTSLTVLIYFILKVRKE